MHTYYDLQESVSVILKATGINFINTYGPYFVVNSEVRSIIYILAYYLSIDWSTVLEITIQEHWLLNVQISESPYTVQTFIID